MGGGAWFVVLNFPPLPRPSLTWLQWLLPGPYEMSDNNDMEVGSYEVQPRFQSAADKQAHHNALERKRRDYIKDSFPSLWDLVPSLQRTAGTLGPNPRQSHRLYPVYVKEKLHTPARY